MNQLVDKPLSINDISAMKRRGEKITCLTAYDASFSAVIDKAGIDMLLVGDSLGMVVQGHSTTLPVTIDNMVYHTQCVSRVRKRAYIIADLPFMTYSSPEIAAKNAAQLLQTGGAQMVKLEGAKVDCIRFLVEQCIPVCGHLGLLPQSILETGGYKIQGRTPASAEQLLKDAAALEPANADVAAARGNHRLRAAAVEGALDSAAAKNADPLPPDCKAERRPCN